jgi:hypothetical protein
LRRLRILPDLWVSSVLDPRLVRTHSSTDVLHATFKVGGRWRTIGLSWEQAY